MAVILDAEGQIMIEQDIRQRLGLKPGYVAVQQIVDGRVEISFYPPPISQRSLRGILHTPGQQPLSTQELSEAREAAWNAAARNEWEGNATSI